jgi:hypothetical protein
MPAFLWKPEKSMKSACRPQPASASSYIFNSINHSTPARQTVARAASTQFKGRPWQPDGGTLAAAGAKVGHQ